MKKKWTVSFHGLNRKDWFKKFWFKSRAMKFALANLNRGFCIDLENNFTKKKERLSVHPDSWELYRFNL